MVVGYHHFRKPHMLATLSSDVPIIHKVGKPERPAKPDIPYVQTYAGWFVGILLMANHNP